MVLVLIVYMVGIVTEQRILWSTRKNAKAQVAILKANAEQACRDNGKLSVEGKEYIVQDGDIMHFRFNV